MDHDGTITAAQLAKLLGVTRSLIYKRAHQGRVTHARALQGPGKYQRWAFHPESRLTPNPRHRPRHAHAYTQD